MVVLTLNTFEKLKLGGKGPSISEPSQINQDVEIRNQHKGKL